MYGRQVDDFQSGTSQDTELIAGSSTAYTKAWHQKEAGQEIASTEYDTPNRQMVSSSSLLWQTKLCQSER